MRYLLAIICPPLAVLFCGKPVQFLLNIVLTLCFWFPGMIHALVVVGSHKADQRTDRLVRAIEHGQYQNAGQYHNQNQYHNTGQGPY